MSVDLDFGGRAFRVEAAQGDEETVVSKHTGKDLRRLSGHIVIGSEQQEDEFEKARSGFKGKAVPELGGSGRSWLVTEQSSQSRTTSGSGITTYVHELVLEEYESHTAEELVLDTLTVRPYAYEEEIDDEGGMRIDAKVALNPADTVALRKLLLGGSDYFDVRRTGLSDAPRRMRFGKVFWSKDGETRKFALVLIDESQDSGRWAKHFVFNEDRGVRSGTAYYMGVVDALQDLLVAKGVVTEEEVEKIKEAARAKMDENNHLFFEVDDIDVGT